MGIVIAWPGRSGAAAGRPLQDGEPRGQILFFTGVRYERDGETDGPSEADASSKRQRGPRGRRKRA
ncbi:MAG: hypothetical protein ABWZ80_04610 [Beijerinckiaceae bacterium]